MFFKKDYETKSYDTYVDEQNIVGDYHADQTEKIDYNRFFSDGSVIMDIGCRDGPFIKRFSKTNDVYGIDISTNAFKRAVKSYGQEWAEKHISICDIQNEDFVNPFGVQFDFINFSHVIEHLLDPERALANIKGMMKDDAKMLIIIPGDIPRFKTLEECIKGQPYHEIFWESTQDIREFLIANGLNILEVDEYKLGEKVGEWRVLCEKAN